MSISPDFSAPDGEQTIDLSILEPLIPILRQAQRKDSLVSLRQRFAEQSQVICCLKQDIVDLKRKLQQQTHAYLTYKAKSDRLAQDIQQKSDFIQQLQTQLLEQSTPSSEPDIASFPNHPSMAQPNSLDVSTTTVPDDHACNSLITDAFVQSLHNQIAVQAELMAEQHQQVATLTQQLQQQEQETQVVRSHLSEQVALNTHDQQQIQHLQHTIQAQERAIAELQGRLAYQQSLSHIGEHHLNRWQTRTFSR